VTFGAVLDELFDENTDNVNGKDTDDETPKSERSVNEEEDDDSLDDDDSISGLFDADDDVQAARVGALMATGFLLAPCDDLLTVSVFVTLRSFGDPVDAADDFFGELAVMTERGESAREDGTFSSSTLTLFFLSLFLIIFFTAKR